MRRVRSSTLLFIVALVACSPARAQDAADLVVRTNRLENMVRQLSGQIEQLQFENKRLQDQVKRFQEDVDFRLQERNGTPARQAVPQRRSDAFDPGAATGAPGAPRALGSTGTASVPLQSQSGPGAGSGVPGGSSLTTPGINTPGMTAPGRGTAPIAGNARNFGSTGTGIIDDEDSQGEPLDITSLARRSAAASGEAAPSPTAPRTGPSIAATAQASPREALDQALVLYRAKQYEQAEMSLRQLLQSHPRDRLVPDALYWLGESYAARQRHREAAEQFLKVTTEHTTSARAPDALLKLGVSLNALGAKEQACATFAEAGRKFAQNAGPYRQRVDRERARARCTA